MKNKFAVLGDETIIYIQKEGITYITIIDTDDLNKIKENVQTLLVADYGLAGRYNKRLLYVTYTAIEGGTKSLHRLLMDTPKGLVVDHINGNPFDNRKSNLRNCTQAENARNLDVKSYKTESGIKGITRAKRGWQVSQILNGKRCYLGTFKDLEKAKQVLRAWHKEFKPYMRWENVT